MSKLIDKAKGINFDDDDETPPAPAPSASPAMAAGTSTAPAAERPRTAIGAISASLALGRGVEAENRALKDKLRQFEDATVVEFLDPRRIRPSRFANRHELSYAGADFEGLKAEIASAGRNVQPIKVRRVQPSEGEGAAFEIAFGHRRHRACLELELPVAAVVQELSDTQLFAEMDRENRERANLSPWEQGLMYQRALEQGLFPSLRKLASSLGVQVGNASTAVQLAGLPREVVDAFESPLQLQYRWATPLTAALERDRAAVLRRAGEMAALVPRPAAKDVLARLVGDGAVTSRPAPVAIEVAGKVLGTLDRDASGAVVVRFAAGSLTPAKQRKLEDYLRKLLDA